jgi:hypothetical protein
MSWEISPDPRDADERAALLAAADQALEEERPSAWWLSGLDELGGGPAPKESWSGPGVVEP